MVTLVIEGKEINLSTDEIITNLKAGENYLLFQEWSQVWVSQQVKKVS